jgi:hypothetical protein
MQPPSRSARVLRGQGQHVPRPGGRFCYSPGSASFSAVLACCRGGSGAVQHVNRGLVGGQGPSTDRAASISSSIPARKAAGRAPSLPGRRPVHPAGRHGHPEQHGDDLGSLLRRQVRMRREHDRGVQRRPVGHSPRARPRRLTGNCLSGKRGAAQPVIGQSAVPHQQQRLRVPGATPAPAPSPWRAEAALAQQCWDVGIPHAPGRTARLAFIPFCCQSDGTRRGRAGLPWQCWPGWAAARRSR